MVPKWSKSHLKKVKNIKYKSIKILIYENIEIMSYENLESVYYGKLEKKGLVISVIKLRPGMAPSTTCNS